MKQFLCILALISTMAGALGEGVLLRELPKAAQKTIREQLQGATLGEIERNTEDGKVTFTVNITRAGEEREFTVAEDGKLLSMDVGLEETPPEVQKTIKAQVGQGKLENISKTFEDDAINYEVDMTTTNDAERSFTVALDGRLTSAQLSLEETPPAVQRTIKAHLGNGKLGDIYRLLEDGEISYSVELTRDGKSADLSVAPDGKLQSEQVALEDTPEAVQKTIQEKLGDGKVVRIDKSFELKHGVFPYEIEARKDGKPFKFSVGPKGRFLGTDE
jgi:uncharacterized membrane protein YkoI